MQNHGSTNDGMPFHRSTNNTNLLILEKDDMVVYKCIYKYMYLYPNSCKNSFIWIESNQIGEVESNIIDLLHKS